jgi:hypothetical protein
LQKLANCLQRTGRRSGLRFVCRIAVGTNERKALLPARSQLQHGFKVFGKALGLRGGHGIGVRTNEQHEPSLDAAAAAERLVEATLAGPFDNRTAVVRDSELRKRLAKLV